MITSNQIIDSNFNKNNKQIDIIFNDDKEKKTIILGKNPITYIFDKEKYDITIIEIQENDINYIELIN